MCMHTYNNREKYHKLEYTHHSNKEEIMNLREGLGGWQIREEAEVEFDVSTVFMYEILNKI